MAQGVPIVVCAGESIRHGRNAQNVMAMAGSERLSGCRLPRTVTAGWMKGLFGVNLVMVKGEGGFLDTQGGIIRAR
jgi:hypothetical protein